MNIFQTLSFVQNYCLSDKQIVNKQMTVSKIGIILVSSILKLPIIEHQVIFSIKLILFDCNS